MLQNQFSGALKHYEQIADYSTRDTAVAAITAALIWGICWYVGFPALALTIACGLLVVETALRLMFAGRAPFASLSKCQKVKAALVLNVLTLLFHAMPAAFLASHPSIAIKFMAMFSLVGLQVYITNTWSRIPLFMGALLGALMPLLLVTFGIIVTSPVAPSPMMHWAFAAVYMSIFVFMSVDTLRQKLATERELRGARDAAASRLALLEEAHRHDSLTGLLNRPAFDIALHVMLEERDPASEDIAVILVDLDSFKPINDTYSHDAGDCVLTTTARRLKALLGDNGIVARLGGDEFICALGVSGDAGDAMRFGQQVQTAIGDPVDWQSRQLTVAASVGVAVTGSGPESPDATVTALCTAADQAMFAAKSSPSGDPVLYRKSRFKPRMTAQDKQLLVDSIKNERVRPFYQPKIHLPSGDIIGFEALARWDHPTLGQQNPDIFIDQINELGLQGDFMMSNARHVMNDIDVMLRNGLDPGQVSLNLSEMALATLSGRKEIKALIAKHPYVIKHLTFEITEDVFIARASETIQASIAQFRAMGVRVSLDDFGTGFASFHHLRQLEFDELKIDTTFVAGLGFDPTAEVLVRGFLDIASGLGVNVVAEGVETEGQSRTLINMGCMTAQGFLFSPAVSFDDATKLLRAQQAA